MTKLNKNKGDKVDKSSINLSPKKGIEEMELNVFFFS